MESILHYGEPQSGMTEGFSGGGSYLFLFKEEKSSKETDTNLT